MEISSIIKKVSFKVWSISSCIGSICEAKFKKIDAIEMINEPWIIQWQYTIYTAE